ncbi:MAG: hypothetical protein RSF81_08420 [Oscillospiraceae bacterium]
MSEENLSAEEQLAKVLAKNEELLAEAKKAKADKNEAMAKLSLVEEQAKKVNDVDIEAYKEFVKNKENAEKEKAFNDAKEKGEIDKLITSLNKKHQEELELTKLTLSSQLESKKKAFEKMVKENGINNALAKAKVLPVFVGGAKALIENRVFIEEDEQGNARAVVNVDDETIDVEKYVCEIWASTDEGSAYKQAPSYAGGGAGGNGGRNSNIENPFVTENLTEMMALKLKDPAMYDLLKKQAKK